MNQKMQVFTGENNTITARCYDDGRVVFNVHAIQDGDYTGPAFYGWLEPQSFGTLWWKWTQQTVGEALHAAMQCLHSKEFKLREGQAQIAAAQATIRALADIEKELSA